MKQLLFEINNSSLLILIKQKIICILFFTSIATATLCQENYKSYYLKLSCGRVSFGTGDFLGYSLSFDVSKNIIKKSSFALNKLLFGGELFFENGVKNPVVQNPTTEQFFSNTFGHVSSSILWAKVSYYPFNKIISGFNIQAGPIMGYSYRSTESRASRVVDASGQSTRLSTLSFDNGFTYGYRISTGFEFNISKKFLFGFRLDWANNTKGEINTLAGIKAGIKL